MPDRVTTTDSATTILTWLGNGASVGAVISSLLGWLPPVAAVLALIWYVIQIHESKTIRRWVERRRLRRIAKHKAAIVQLETQGKAFKDLGPR